MLTRFLLLSRLLPVVVPAVLVVSYGPTPAFADDDDEEEDEDEGDGDGDEEEGDEQPPVTAGGLFTKATYPQAELERPLTVIGGMTEVRAGIGIDVSKGQVFKNFTLEADLRHGLKDWFELQGGVSVGLPDAGDTSFAIHAGIEAGLVFDLVDFRALVEVPLSPDTAFDIVLGFPFRYKPQDKVAIIALERLITFHTNSVPNAMGEDEFRKPDLTVDVGVVYQAAPMLAALLHVTLVLPAFDPDLLAVPAGLAAQFSPNNKVDIGLEFRLANVKEDNRFDLRFLFLYAQFRF